ncbi:---NA---, partial [Paramuricea clavata]
TKLPTCEYFVELSFLRDIVTDRKTESNIPTEITIPTSSVYSTTPPTHTVTDTNSTQSNPSSCDAISIRNARKRRSDQLDELLALSLSNDKRNDKKEATNNMEQTQDEDVLFCSSLVKTFQKLKGKMNKKAKMMVMQVLLEFEDDDDNDA